MKNYCVRRPPRLNFNQSINYKIIDHRINRSVIKLKSTISFLETISIIFVFNCLFASNVEAALMASSVMRTDTFDSLDSASFCDARRFEIVEGSSGLIYSHKPYYPSSIYRPGRDCFMTLKAPIGYRLELTALEFQVGERFAPSRRCAGDSLHIFDQDKPDPSKKTRSHQDDYQEDRSLTAILSSNSLIDSPIQATLCGRIKNNTIIARSTMNVMTLWWHSEPTISVTPTPSSSLLNVDRLLVTPAIKRGFKLQWTAFRESAQSGCNGEKEFACSNKNMCIPVELACDNVAHCNDRSDLLPERQRSAGCEDVEAEASSSTPAFTVGSLAGICVGALLLLVLALVLFSVCRKRQRLTRRQHKYNQAPLASSLDKADINNRNNTTASALAPTTTTTNNSSNSSNSDNSRCPSSSTDSRNNGNRLCQQQQPSQFPHPYPQYHQIDPPDALHQNGTYYQPYYLAENGVSYQTKLLYHQHHHHPQPPIAPPPSMVGIGANGGVNYENPKNPQSFYYQQQQQAKNSDARQPMIA